MRRVPFVPVGRVGLHRCALLAVAAMAVPSGSALSVECSEFPAPTAFTAQLESNVHGEPQVVLRWTPVAGQDVNPEFVFRYWRVERRDDTAGGAFQSLWDNGAQPSSSVIPSLDDYATSAFFNRVEDPAVFPPCEGIACPKPGRTYTYRVMPRYSHAFGCDQYANNATKSGPPTAEIQIAVPGPAPGNDAPKNVVAVAEVKKPRVHVRWDPPATGAPESYEILRGVADAGPSKGGQKATNFTKIFELGGGATSFLDKDVVPDETYEYVVASVVAGQTRRSAADRASTQPGKCPASAFDVWGGRWHATDGTFSCNIGFGSLDGEKLFNVSLVDEQRNAAGDRYGSVSVLGTAPLLVKRKLAFSPIAEVQKIVTTDGPVPEWAAGLKQGDRGRFRLAMKPRDRFAPDVWRVMTAELQIGGADLSLDGTLEIDEGDGDSIEYPTVLCGTVAAGVANADPGNPQPGKYRPVKPGENVVFVFQVIALGPSPLWSRRVAVEAQLENGVILQTTEEGARVAGSPAGLKAARFVLGALGPDKRGRSEIATIVVIATVEDGGPGSQLRCTFSFRSDGSDLDVTESQPVEFEQREPVELMIDRTGIAKR